MQLILANNQQRRGCLVCGEPLRNEQVTLLKPMNDIELVYLIHGVEHGLTSNVRSFAWGVCGTAQTMENPRARKDKKRRHYKAVDRPRLSYSNDLMTARLNKSTMIIYRGAHFSSHCVEHSARGAPESVSQR